ncbi:hypothetical protein FB451DRAFT_1397049 [Mycena latifolia]|nr:hypothetical protein FB451DRAFT_1397049 [Mycena latifolia]
MCGLLPLPEKDHIDRRPFPHNPPMRSKALLCACAPRFPAPPRLHGVSRHPTRPTRHSPRTPGL